MGIRKILASDPQEMFCVAEDFRFAYSALFAHTCQTWAPHRMTAPQCMIGAFVLEMYLKCLLADDGAKDFPGTHDLKMLFDELKKPTRDGLILESEKDGASRHWPLDEVMTDMKDCFPQWRYRFEFDKTKLLVLPFGPFHDIFHNFIVSRHPDWERDADHHFQSTFPAP